MDLKLVAQGHVNEVDAEPGPQDFRQTERFILAPDHMPPWEDDNGKHAEQFAAFLRHECYSPVMIMGAIGAVAEMTTAYWVLVDGRPAKRAISRIRDWRQTVLGLHPLQTAGPDGQGGAA